MAQYQGAGGQNHLNPHPTGAPGGYMTQQTMYGANQLQQPMDSTNTYTLYMPGGYPAQNQGQNNYAQAAVQAALSALGGQGQAMMMPTVQTTTYGGPQQPLGVPPPPTENPPVDHHDLDHEGQGQVLERQPGQAGVEGGQYHGYGGYLQNTSDGRPNLTQVAQAYGGEYSRLSQSAVEPEISPLWNPAWGDPYTDASTMTAYQQWLALQESTQQPEGSYYADGAGTGSGAPESVCSDPPLAAHQVGYDPTSGGIMWSGGATSTFFIPSRASQLIHNSMPQNQVEQPKAVKPEDDPKKVYHKGWLNKQGGSRARGFFSSRNWKRRYFILKDRQIKYYRSRDDARQDKNPLRTILVDEMRVQRADHIIDKKRSIELYHAGMANPFYIQAENRQQQEEWRIALIKAAARPGQAPDSVPTVGSKNDRNPILPPGLDIPAGSRVIIRRQTRYQSDSSSEYSSD